MLLQTHSPRRLAPVRVLCSLDALTLSRASDEPRAPRHFRCCNSPWNSPNASRPRLEGQRPLLPRLARLGALL